MTKLTKTIERLHWVWFWSGNWPLLDALLERDASFEREFLALAGVYPKKSIDFHTNGTITAYHCQEEYNRIGSYLISRFEKESRFILRSVQDYSKKTSRDVAALRILAAKDVAAMDSATLASHFLKIRSHFSYNAAVDHYTWYIEHFFVPKIQEYAQTKISSQKLKIPLSDCIHIILAPLKPSRAFFERRSFFKIVQATKKRKMLVNRLNQMSSYQLHRQNPGIARLIQQHVDSYNWLGVLVNNPPLSFDDVWLDVKAHIYRNKAFKIESKRLGDSYNSRIKLMKREIMKQLKPTPIMNQLIKSLEEIAYIRTEDSAIMGLSSYLARGTYLEVAKRLGITYYHLKEFTSEEIVHYLSSTKEADKHLLKERLQLTCTVVEDSKLTISTGVTALRLKSVVENQFSPLPSSKTITGMPAWGGYAKGIARVLTNSNQIDLIQPGDILVAPATSADFVPALRKSKAIITEAGGLTSHAAVVAREFNIPCIVGVSQATQRIADGEMVEVNASKGTVKRLKPQP